MAHPQKVNLSLQVGLLLVFLGSISIGNGVAILFSPSYTFEGDVLQVMPGTSWVPLLVRLLFIFVIAVKSKYPEQLDNDGEKFSLLKPTGFYNIMMELKPLNSSDGPGEGE